MEGFERRGRPMITSETTRRLIDGLTKDLPQGILLAGPVGIGLLTTAWEIAAAYTKEIITVSPDDKGTITIDAVRDLYTLGRSKGSMTIVIIDDADAMGIPAQNSLLKLLEEPVASLRFILTSHVPDQLLPTIRSRVATYTVTPVSASQSKELLDTLKVTDATQRAQMLFIAEGLPAALTRLATTPKIFNARAAVVRDARTFLQGSREERLLLAATYKDRVAADGLVTDMLALLRRSIEVGPKPASLDSVDRLLDAQAALAENASVRLTLTRLSLAL